MTSRILPIEQYRYYLSFLENALTANVVWENELKNFNKAYAVRKPPD